MSQVLRLGLERRRQALIRSELEPLGAVLASLDNPQLSFPSISLIGTNGKGSTASMLAALLQALGLRVGLFTSPHLVRIEDSIRVSGTPIPTSSLERHLARLQPWEDLSFFETLTAAAFLELHEAAIDCAVLETGLGAPWDATLLARTRLAGVTNIGTDHSQWLGSTRQEIAATKGAAAALADLAVVGPGVDRAIQPHLALTNAVAASDLVPLDPVEASRGHRLEAHMQAGSCLLSPPLDGDHQVSNLHLALAMAEASAQLGLAPTLTADAVIRGLATVTLEGRLSRHRINGRTVVLDGAHNLEGARALAKHLRAWPDRPGLVFSCLEDKPVEAMAEVLLPEVGATAICPVNDPRAMSLDRLRSAFPTARVHQCPMEALASLEDPVIAAGSLRLVGELLACSEPGSCP